MIGNFLSIMDSELGDAVSELLNKFANLSNDKIVLNHYDDELEYTIKEIQFLRILSENPGVKNIEIAKSLGITKGMVSKMIKKLRDDYEVITREENEENRREIVLNLTNKGRSQLARYTNLISIPALDIFDIWTSIPEEHQDSFMQIIRKYTEVLDLIGDKNRDPNR